MLLQRAPAPVPHALADHIDEPSCIHTNDRWALQWVAHPFRRDWEGLSPHVQPCNLCDSIFFAKSRVLSLLSASLTCSCLCERIILSRLTGTRTRTTDWLQAISWQQRPHDKLFRATNRPVSPDMNVEMQFDATRWRENTRPTPISAPTPRSPRDARNLVQQYNQVPWDKNNAQQQQPIAASAFRAYAPAQASPPHQRAGDAAENLRHTTATPRPHQNELAFVSPHQPANNSTTQGSLGSHSDQTKPRDPYAQGADGPLALQIPRSSGMYRPEDRCKYPRSSMRTSAVSTLLIMVPR